ncbi:DNA ligase D [Coralloluteibacterium stylophorae]|uniref:DNA ligase (ATP) n=1 Tax=Coralloluteibacterium stylophorae TaxID=1776034 RepID=A0A8J7VVL5_9GAMM|nr:DNA ligase D [Coralloluteibacterium stylophorae]MBS7457400.1 DNA ligase D [Coralloluteibacterium stylophorae]
MSLQEYVRKRRFGDTPEPSDEAQARRNPRGGRRPIFVIQLHHARARHFDFRLEADGVLKSWAVPKGPSLRAGEKRLAMQVEDHPLSYASFEGDIPEGNYGAGHVVVFDHGVWACDGDPLEAIAAGKLDFELHGGRMEGAFKLVRTHMRGSKPSWLLIKRSDAFARDADADDFVPTELGGTGRELGTVPAAAAKTKKATKTTTKAAKQARAGAPAARSGGTGARAAAKKATKKPSRRACDWRAQALALEGARDRPLAAGFRPQLCALREAPPRGEDWLHEVKWDGYRLLVDLDDGRARLRSRNDLDWSEDFPDIRQAIEALPVASGRFDGELVALDAQGRSDFSALQRTIEGSARAPLRYLMFDMPALEGVDLGDAPLVERKRLLEALLAHDASAALAFSQHIVGQGEKVFAASAGQGLEGIVCKRVDAGYAQGRGGGWVKVKHAHSDEFVVVGWSAPKGARQGFGALLMAQVVDGALRYVGRVGTGYDDRTIKALMRRLAPLEQDTPTLALPAHLPAAKRGVTWVRPELVVEVAFRGWAKEGLLRQASFQRVREDKGPADLGLRSEAEEDVEITHPERVVFPADGITKGQVADYYRAVAPLLMPELVDRPLSLIRCPDGAEGTCFFQKHHAAKLGDRVGAIPIREKGGDREDYLYVGDRAALMQLVQMNTLEFHPWGARIDDPEHPDRIVFDLDPGDGVEWKAIVAAAREIRARLQEVGLESFVRLSGGKGLHVVVPLDRSAAWDEAKAFCEAFARAMAAQAPERYLAVASKAKRPGRIFIDWLRNGRGATSVTNWSLRARPGAPVAVPLRWEELGRTRSGADYDMQRALRRARSDKADAWAGIDAMRQALPALD